MTCWLVRHTRLHGNDGLCYGHHEFELAATFEDEAAAVEAALPWKPGHIWTSPSLRCLRLARRLANGVSIRTDTRLRELHFGEWEGRRWDDLKGVALDTWMSDPWRARPPGGETAEELLARVREVRAEILGAGAASQGTVVVTHGGVIRAWLAIAQGTDLATQFRTPVPYGAVVEGA